MKKKKAIIGLLFSISLCILSLFLFIFTLIENRELLPFAIILGIIFFFMGIVNSREMYQYCLSANIKLFKNRLKDLTDEEKELVEDAKNLVRKVDKSIIIADFYVYKVNYLKNGLFNYDEDTKELNIFIPFKRFMKYGKDLCFMAVLHEILHSQNVKNNTIIFTIDFLEGLNQFFTIWLIKNYSEKYKLLKKIVFKTKNYDITMRVEPYKKQVKIAQKILQESNIDLKEAFLKYIDFQPEFYKEFVPEKYLEKH